MTKLEVGTITTLQVADQEGSRWLLVNEHGDEVYMNASEQMEDIEVGENIDVFLYLSRREEIVATMFVPRITVGTYGWAEVIRVERDEGAYVDIGANIEVLVDRSDLPHVEKLWPQNGDQLYMTLRTDGGGTLFARLATEELVRATIAEAPEELHNADMKARPYRLLPVGSFLLTEEPMYRIFVHESERTEEPRLGSLVDVRIIGVKDDGTMNGSFLPRREERLDHDAQVIYDYLQQVGGEMPFTDKSSPQEIQDMFQMSKGAFKRALGRLMKKRLIVQEDGWTKFQS